MGVDESGPHETGSGTESAVPPLEQFADLSAWAAKKPKKTDARGQEGILPGTIGDEVSRPKRFLRTVVIILVLLAIVLSIVGLIERQELTDFVRSLPLGRSREVTFLESRDDKVLMLETHGNTSRVLVQTHGQASWQLVSKDDTSAANPALSVDAAYVAYVSTRNKGEVVIVSLSDDTEKHIASEDISDFLRNTAFSETKVCPWTPVSWSPDGQQVAFFVCRKKPSLSVVLVAEPFQNTINLSTISGSEASSSSPRQIQWTGSNEITFSVPEITLGQGDEIRIMDIPTATPTPDTP